MVVGRKQKCVVEKPTVSDPINDRVTKVLAFKYSPDTQTADLFLDELAMQVKLDRQYIKDLEQRVDFLEDRIRELENA